MQDIDNALSAISSEIHAKPVRNPWFTGSVTSISDDRSTIRVKLCTGANLDVPRSLLKNLTHLGTASYDNERCGLASGEIDVSTDAGILFQQMAQEITRLCRLLQTTRERLFPGQGGEIAGSVASHVEKTSGEGIKSKLDPSDTPLPQQTMKMAFRGIAGSPVIVRYDAPPNEYIAVPFVGHPTWSVSNFNGCFFTQPPQLADPFGRNTWINFFCDAAHGTPIGQSYSASFWLTVDLNLRTT